MFKLSWWGSHFSLSFLFDQHARAGISMPGPAAAAANSLVVPARAGVRGVALFCRLVDVFVFKESRRK